jgi:thymidylate synthase (FAD)
MANAILNICKKEMPFIFENAGAPCSETSVCKETKKFSCGMYKTFGEILDEYNEHIG